MMANLTFEYDFLGFRTIRPLLVFVLHEGSVEKIGSPSEIFNRSADERWNKKSRSPFILFIIRHPLVPAPLFVLNRPIRTNRLPVRTVRLAIDAHRLVFGRQPKPVGQPVHKTKSARL
jgi:hypothetical protein